jgi:hypothetical protein
MGIAGVIVFFLFFMSLGGDTSSNDETQNMGQAHHATVPTEPGVPGSAGTPTGFGGPTGGNVGGGYNSGGNVGGGYKPATDDDMTTGADQEALGEVVDEAVEDIQLAEEAQLEQSENMLGSALSSIGNVRYDAISVVVCCGTLAVTVLESRSILTFH